MNNGNGFKRGLIYRQMPQTAEDWDRLHAFLSDVKGFVPPPHLGVAAIAETSDGEMVAALVLQLVSYLGPLKISPKWAGHIEHEKLKRVIDSTFKNPGPGSLIIQGYVAMTDNEAVARIAENAGMKRLEGCITLVQTLDKERPIPTLD